MSARNRRLLLLCVVLATAIASAHAQDYDAGKSGAQLFASNCSSCHRSPRGLAKDRFSWSLTNYLRQHYTSTPASAQELTTYLLSVGGAPRRANQRPRAGKPPRSTTNRSWSPILPPATVPNR